MSLQHLTSSFFGMAAAVVIEPAPLDQELLSWTFRGVLGVAFALIYHQLRTANKKLDSIESLDKDVRDLERYIRAIVSVFSRDAELGKRSTDQLILSIEHELRLKETSNAR